MLLAGAHNTYNISTDTTDSLTQPNSSSQQHSCDVKRASVLQNLHDPLCGSFSEYQPFKCWQHCSNGFQYSLRGRVYAAAGARLRSRRCGCSGRWGCRCSRRCVQRHAHACYRPRNDAVCRTRRTNLCPAAVAAPSHLPPPSRQPPPPGRRHVPKKPAQHPKNTRSQLKTAIVSPDVVGPGCAIASGTNAASLLGVALSNKQDVKAPNTYCFKVTNHANSSACAGGASAAASPCCAKDLLPAALNLRFGERFSFLYEGGSGGGQGVGDQPDAPKIFPSKRPTLPPLPNTIKPQAACASARASTPRCRRLRSTASPRRPRSARTAASPRLFLRLPTAGAPA